MENKLRIPHQIYINIYPQTHCYQDPLLQFEMFINATYNRSYCLLVLV